MSTDERPLIPLDFYQEQARTTAVYQNPTLPVPCYTVYGIIGEACEFLAEIAAADRQRLASEGGDVWWYIAALASDCNEKLSTIYGGEGPHLVDALARYRGGISVTVARDLLPNAFGRLAENTKKMLRDDGCILLPPRRTKIIAAAMDIGVGVAAILNDQGITTEQAMRGNLEKLAARKAKGTLHGDGNAR